MGRIFYTYCVCILFLSSLLHSTEFLPITIKGAYFYPTSSRYRDIYSDARRYSIETGVQAWKSLYAFGGAGLIYTTGSSVGLGNSTRLYTIPLNLGLKWFFLKERVRPYFSGGITVAYSNIKNNSSFSTQSPSGWGVGGVWQAGVLAYFAKCFFFDFFLDYTYLRTSFSSDPSKITSRNKATLSGLAIGGGLGVSF